MFETVLHSEKAINLGLRDFFCLLWYVFIGFRLDRISGGHHIFLHPDLPELINLQNVKGKAKPYQIKQLLKIIEKYNLHMEGDE